MNCAQDRLRIAKQANATLERIVASAINACAFMVEPYADGRVLSFYSLD